MENRRLNDNYRIIAEKLITEEKELSYILNSSVRIAFLESDLGKRGKDKIIYGQCEKVAAKNKWAISYDFTITIFKPNIEGFSDEQLKILLFHELLHVGVEQREDGGESYYCRKHDLEDFKIIIDRFGTDWTRKGDS